jgi:hypothetical protein
LCARRCFQNTHRHAVLNDHIRGEASAAASQPASHSLAQNTNHKTVPAGEKTHQRTSGSGDAACPGPGC